MHEEILQKLNKRTKIVATIGPASNTLEMLESLALGGMNCVRLNMSHGTHESHQQVINNVREVSEKISKPIAILADLQGPKIRLGELPAEGLSLNEGEAIQFTYSNTYTPDGPIPVQHDITKYTRAGQAIYLRDGMVKVIIDAVEQGIISGTLQNSGIIFSKQGINLPDTDLGGDILTDKDLRDIDFAAQADIDYVALSFVQSATDIYNLRQQLEELGSDALIVAKIETKAAIDNMTEIVAAADVIMVARGDLAVEVGPERVPVIQRQLVQLCQTHQKIVIVATQMLESMIDSPQPTRAEVSDVATAVAQGADAVMLSAESATGKYPLETVQLMKRIILYNEENRMFSISRDKDNDQSNITAISLAVITLARQTGAKRILAETASGSIARHITSFRPEILVLGVTDQRRTYNQLAIVWGARSYLIKDPATAREEVVELLKADHDVVPGDIVVRTSGLSAGVTGTTNTIQIEAIS